MYQPPQQVGVGADGERGGHDHEIEVLFLRHRREIGFDAFQQLVQRHRCYARFHRTRVEAGNIEHRAENGFDRLERRIDVLDEIAFPRGAKPLDQRGGIKPGGIQRLEDIVAGGSKKPCLADIRLVGRCPCLRKFAVDAGKLDGSFRHPLLQRFIGLFQRLIARHSLRDIGEGGDDTLVRHGVGAHFDDALAAA